MINLNARRDTLKIPGDSGNARLSKVYQKLNINVDSKILPIETNKEPAVETKTQKIERPQVYLLPSQVSAKPTREDLDSKLSEEVVDKESSQLESTVYTVVENVRLSAKKFLTTHPMGQLYQYILLILSILSSLQFIYQTYISSYSYRDDVQLRYFRIVEEALACLFMFDWVLSFFIADHKVNHIMSFFSMVDLLTVIPIWITRDQECIPFDGIKSFSDAAVYIVCGLTTTRILRALRIRRKLILAIEDDVQRCLSEIILVLVTMILFNSALMQYLEPGQSLPFHTWTYYMLVTISTVGYGDISPETDLGRAAAMLMIVFAIITVPKMTNELIETMALQSVWSRLYYQPKNGRSQHVVICGDLNSCSITEFFEELFHEDHENDNLHAVILQPGPPSYEIMTLLKDPNLTLFMTYLEGTALNDRDLTRAKADSAVSIFIMTNKFSTNPDEEDSKTILQQFSIKRFMATQGGQHNTLFCMQLIRPENKRHLVGSPDEVAGSDIVLCLNEIKMGILSKAVICPGFTAFLMNLLTSFADDDDGDPPEIKNAVIENLDDDEMGNWIGEYQRGCDWEIYTTELSAMFCGSSFSSISNLIYQKLGVVLFGFEIEDIRKEKAAAQLILNPGNFIIPDKKEFRIEAFVLAQNKAQSDLNFTEEKFDEFESGKKKQFILSQIAEIASDLSRTKSRSESKEDSSRHSINVQTNPQAMFEFEDSARNEKFKYAWQKALHSYDYQKSQKDRYQEKMQAMEDKFMQENYYIRVSPAELSEVIVRTTVVDEIPNIDNHLIIIGKSINNLYDLIRPLRAKYLGQMKYIVILYPFDIPSSAWRRISMFEGILVVRGSGLEEADVRRAGIYRAAQVVVLADTVTDRSSQVTVKNNKGTNNDALIDADAIFTYQCVKRMNPQVHSVVEIVSQNNVSYLDPEVAMASGDIDYKFTPQFASGTLFTSSMLDTLAGQAFYNPKIVHLLNELVSGVDSKNAQSTKLYTRSPASNASSGHQSNGIHNIMKSSLYQINVPESMESKTYGALYTLLSKRNIIPLGIFRGVYAHLNIGPKANKSSYVFTNPPKDTELFTCDKVFVLSQTPLISRDVALGEMQMKESLFYDQLRRKKNMVEETSASLAKLREDVSNLQLSQASTKEEMLKVVNGRFDEVLSVIKHALVNPSSGSSSSGRTRSVSTSETKNRSPSLFSYGHGGYLTASPETKRKLIAGGPSRSPLRTTNSNAGGNS